MVTHGKWQGDCLTQVYQLIHVPHNRDKIKKILKCHIMPQLAVYWTKLCSKILLTLIARELNINFILLERLMLVLFEWSYFKRLFNAGGRQYKQVMFGTSSDVDTTAHNWGDCLIGVKITEITGKQIKTLTTNHLIQGDCWIDMVLLNTGLTVFNIIG